MFPGLLFLYYLLAWLLVGLQLFECLLASFQTPFSAKPNVLPVMYWVDICHGVLPTFWNELIETDLVGLLLWALCLLLSVRSHSTHQFSLDTLRLHVKSPPAIFSLLYFHPLPNHFEGRHMQYRYYWSYLVADRFHFERCKVQTKGVYLIVRPLSCLIHGCGCLALHAVVANNFLLRCFIWKNICKGRQFKYSPPILRPETEFLCRRIHPKRAPWLSI